jgi:hypothetical protein
MPEGEQGVVAGVYDSSLSFRLESYSSIAQHTYWNNQKFGRRGDESRSMNDALNPNAEYSGTGNLVPPAVSYYEQVYLRLVRPDKARLQNYHTTLQQAAYLSGQMYPCAFAT